MDYSLWRRAAEGAGAARDPATPTSLYPLHSVRYNTKVIDAAATTRAGMAAALRSRMTVFDLADWLREWPYDPEENIRVVTCADGRDVLQVRLPMGVEQYELDGRPDGERPHGGESELHYQLDRLGQAAEGEFSLSHEECVGLINEGTIYYFRYVHLFQLQDWPRTERDTARNLCLFDLVHEYAEGPEDADCLEQWRPYILRMHAVARAMIQVEAREHLRALEIVAEAIAAIEALDGPEDNATFDVEKSRSLEVLRSLEVEIGTSRPLTEVEEFEKEMRDAVAQEDYERAAELRDLIQVLRTQGGKTEA